MSREGDKLSTWSHGVEGAWRFLEETLSSGQPLRARDREAIAFLIAQRDDLAPLTQRLAKSRAKYPNGCTVLSLIDEAGEVAHAVNKYEPAERVREELLDVASVAMRLYLGEIDRGLKMDGLIQRRSEPIDDHVHEVGGCRDCPYDAEYRAVEQSK